MRTAARNFAGKVAVRRAIEAARDSGIDVGGIDLCPDGTIRILSAKTAHTPLGNAFDEWKESRSREG